MKIVLCIILVVLFGGIGYGISSNYIKRKRFFFELNNFLIFLKTEISFSQTKLETIINNFKQRACSKDLIILLDNYLISLSRNLLTKDNLFQKTSILSEQEKESIYLFFNGLGKIDVFNQIDVIEKFINTSAEYLNIAKEESSKYSALYTKLGIIIGAFLSLVII